jgi:hypothetical protein
VSARLLRWGISVLVLASSGLYFFVYLYRWEWNRALVAAAIFIMMEIGVAAAAIFSRIASLEKRLAERPAPEALDRIQETAPPPRANFRWLAGGSDQMSVFVPVLMGAGLVVSGIAWLVERLAHATARPVMEQRLAMQLQPLAMPAGGLTSDMPSVAPTYRSHRARRSFALLICAALMSILVDQLGDLTQTRPDVVPAGSTATVTIEISDNGWSRSQLAAAETLWSTCRTTVPPSVSESGWTATGNSTFRMNLSAGLGDHTVRQLHGCLEDAGIDNIQGKVLEITTHPPV